MIGRLGASTAGKAIGVGGVLVVAAALAIKAEVHQKKIKKQREYYKAVNRLVELYLNKAPAPGYDPLPPIFTESKADEAGFSKTVALQIQVLENLFKTPAVYNDPHLREYGHHILNAMRAIAKFYSWRINHRNYFFRGTKDDITSSVLSYVVLMLSQHCVKFEGYEVDVAYLDNLSKFLNAFASMKKKKNTERFEHLTTAYNELLKARAILNDHSTQLSLDEKLSLFDSKTTNVLERMIRLYTKFTLPADLTDEVDLTNIDHLADGFISPRYKEHHTILDNGLIRLPTCIMSDWLQQCSMDYINSLPVKQERGIPEMSPEKKMPLRGAKDYPDKIKELQKVFANVNNIMTETVKKKDAMDATDEFVSAKQESLILERAGIFYDFYQLIRRLIAARKLCANIWMEAKRLGEQYMEEGGSPYLDCIFGTVNLLSKQMEDLSKGMKQSLEKLELSFTDAMSLEGSNNLLDELKVLLKDCDDDIIPGMKDIVARHKGRSKVDADKCDLLESLQEPDLATLDTLKLKSLTAYVLCQGKLYYLDAIQGNCDEVTLSPDKIAEFKQKMSPTALARTLSLEELKDITLITAHVRTKPPVTIHASDKLLKVTKEIRLHFGIDTGHELIPSEAVVDDSAETKAKKGRRSRPGYTLLYSRILDMRLYGEKLVREGSHKGKVARDLADKLEDKVDNFLGAFSEKQQPSDRAFVLFRRDFKELLHSEDRSMSQHRAGWKPVLGNILLALTILGLFLQLGKLIYAKATKSQSCVFFGETARQKQMDKVEGSLNKLENFPEIPVLAPVASLTPSGSASAA